MERYANYTSRVIRVHNVDWSEVTQHLVIQQCFVISVGI